ncbi:MAG: sigma-70 family RNA polymerase sigma factor [bacterium]|nr:sigma-70 family RNA polymerase sigma factor [bacterium]
MSDDDRDIREYLNGSMSAFHRLYARYERPLFFYIKSMVRQHETAEDIFQSVWQQVITKLPGFGFKGAFHNWLFAIAHHKVIDFMRANLPSVVSLDDRGNDHFNLPVRELIADPAPDVLRQLNAKELWQRVLDVVATLPPAQREVFTLRLESGLTFKQIAALQGTSLNTVLGRMHYALTRVRAALKDDEAKTP